MPINVGKEILSPSGMLKGAGEEMMQLIIVCIERVYSSVEIVFDLIPFIGLMRIVVVPLLYVLKFSSMFLVLHSDNQYFCSLNQKLYLREYNLINSYPFWSEKTFQNTFTANQRVTSNWNYRTITREEPSVLLYHITKSKSVVVVNGRNRSH